MIEPAAFYDALERHGLRFFTGVPDSLLKDLCAYVTEHVPPTAHVINANEGSAVALAAGYHIATGRIPVVYMQNSGLGNAINPLLSLADPAVYAIPMLVLIGWRGEPGVEDEPQHMTQGRVMAPLLGAIEMPYEVLDAETDFEETLTAVMGSMREVPRPHAILVRRGTFAPHRAASASARDLPLTRANAVDAVLDTLPSDALLVSTTGMASREVFAHREHHGQGHERDFLTVGSMGHCSQIALGLAQQHGHRSIVCLDGDGAVLMHMGSLAIIGSQGPANFHHVVINNGAHDSVGGQPTAALRVDLSAIARACGYRDAGAAATEADVRRALAQHVSTRGPSFLEITVASSPHTDAGRPTSTPVENKAALMRELGANVG